MGWFYWYGKNVVAMVRYPLSISFGCYKGTFSNFCEIIEKKLVKLPDSVPVPQQHWLPVCCRRMCGGTRRLWTSSLRPASARSPRSWSPPSSSFSAATTMRWDLFYFFSSVAEPKFRLRNLNSCFSKSPRSWSPPSSSSSAATTMRWDLFSFISSVAEPKFRLRNRKSCYSKVTKIMVTAINFFLGSDNDEVGF